MRSWALGLGLGALVVAGDARAWIESEHVQLTESAVVALGPRTPVAEALEELWAAARRARPQMATALCAHPLPAYQRGCVGLAELPMLAADHACSPGDLLQTLERVAAGSRASPDALAVVAVAEKAHRDLDRVSASAKTRVEGGAVDRDDLAAELRAERLRVRRELDFNLEVADHDYLGRASGVSHFVLQARGVTSGLDPFLRQMFRAPSTRFGAVPFHATAGYAAYHALALRYAMSWRAEPHVDERALWALLFEAFALHFLEDAFSAGHWVDAATISVERFGTHDHYSEYGLEARLWKGGFYTAHGDAYLGADDEHFAVAALDAALGQFVAASAGVGPPFSRDDLARLGALHVPKTLSTCVPADGAPLEITDAFTGLADLDLLRDVILLTPRPMAAYPGVPHFRAEVGIFIPFGVSVGGGPLHYTSGNWSSSLGARLSVGGIGGASDSALSDMKDGYAFLTPLASFETESLTTVDFGPGFRVRIPYVAYVPGDFLIWLPFLLAELHGSQTSVGSAGLAKALNGHFWYPSPSIRFQWELGRELEFVFAFQQVPGVDRATTRFVRWDLTLPVATARLVHAFSDTYSNDVLARIELRVGHERDAFPVAKHDGEPVTGTFVGPVLVFAQASRAYLGGTSNPPRVAPARLDDER